MTAEVETRPSILIVDDEPRILSSIQDLLDEEYSVEMCTDALGALEKLQHHEVAVILSDQRMPGMQGHQFLARAREISQATRVLITGYSDQEALVNAVNRGQIYAYVAKPWDPAGLKATVAGAAEYHRLQMELAHERDLLHALMDNLPDRIYFQDADARFLRVNDAQARFLGVADPSQIVGLCRPDDDDTGILETGCSVIDKVERLDLDGEDRWYSTTKVAIRDQRGQIQGLVGVSRDVTERKRAEEALIRQAGDLARQNAELDQFAYVSAHDLQEPLRTVASFAQLLGRRYHGKLDAEADKYIDLIIGGATRMRQLIHDLLDYSRVAWHETALGPTDCQAVFHASLDDLQHAIAESGAAVTSDPLPTVCGNARCLQQLFLNLIGNALKFRGPEPPCVHVAVERRNDHWLFAVRDNGIGIAPQFVERIFTVFQRLHSKEQYPGTGIGLAICKRIVERHRGLIWVESTLGEGSAFYFTLAMVADAAR